MRSAIRTGGCCIRRNHRAFKALHHLLQPLGIGSEVLRDVYGAAEVRNSDQTVGAGIRVNKLCGCIPGFGLIAKVHGRVVEEQNEVAWLCSR